jgi:hypothetical protein
MAVLLPIEAHSAGGTNVPDPKAPPLILSAIEGHRP